MSIKDRFFEIFKDKDISKKKDIMYNMLVFPCMFIHILYAVFFIIFDLNQLTYYNAFSILLYLLMVILRKRVSLLAFMFIFNFEVSFFASIAIITMGFTYGFQILFLLLMSTNIFFLNTNVYVKYIIMILEGIVYFVLYIREGMISGYESSAMTFYLINFLAYVIAVILINYIAIVFFEMKNKLQSEKLIREKEIYKKIAEYDPLTGLGRKQYMEKKLDDILSEYADDKCGSIVLIFADIDNFKHINDTYGHINGDIVLAKIGDIFRDSFRQEDILCRWGGEEFMVLMSDVKRGYAYNIVDKLRRRIEKEVFDLHEEKIFLTMTFGVLGIYDLKQLEREYVVEITDDLLYEGKNSGKNKVVYKEI